LGRTGYEKCMHSAGLRLIATYTDSGDNHYYEAQRIV
jgi:hypothetical protein